MVAVLALLAVGQRGAAQVPTTHDHASPWTIFVDVVSPLSIRDLVGRELSPLPLTHFPDPTGRLAVRAFRRYPLLLNGRNVRLVVSTQRRTLVALVGRDTVFAAPVAVALGLTLAYGSHRWTFQTPRGSRRVLRKLVDPVWTPPDWHYAEAAIENGLRLERLPRNGFTLGNGTRLVVRHGAVGLLMHGARFEELPTDEHVVFDDRLFIPPVGTRNRRVVGDLGRYALDLGNGYMIHGTPNAESIGQASTHGCIRLRDDDLAWLFAHVSPGARVLIQ